MRAGWAASVVVLLLSSGAPLAAASDGARQIVDRDGVVHLTNVPADPRYRGLPGASGTAVGWLRLPAPTSRGYAAEIREISREYGVSPGLVEAVVRTESGFDATAISPKGAGGLMQLMPRTASALGVRDRFDPRQNIRGGVRHLRYLLDRYQGSVPIALAAYNAGEAAVDGYQGVPPFPETQAYVERVMRQAAISDSTVVARSRLYRSRAADGSVTYSNIVPTLRPRSSHR